MVAAVQTQDGRLGGLHRTFLRPNGSGKADVEPVKKMLGACRGGAVNSPCRTTARPLRRHRDRLQHSRSLPRPRGWCALSAGNLDRLALPAEVEEAVLVADGDPAGLAAAHRAAQRYGASGRRIRLVELPSGMDADDMLRHRSAAAA